MANKQLFASRRSAGYVPPTNAVNEAGGVAYATSARHALAQYASTGTFHGVFYSSAEEQLDSVVGLLDQILQEPTGELFIAKVAVYTRRQGFMKDMPALLTAYLGCKGRDVFERTFRVVIDNGRMLRTFVQMIRSGKLGRRSFGSRMKRAIRAWFNSRNPRTLLNASVGNNPSLADIIRMVHPRPQDVGIFPREHRQRELLYGYLLGRVKGDTAGLPGTVLAYEHFKKFGGPLPDVNFQLLTSAELTSAQWVQMAQNAGHQWLRMNLNALYRHQTFEPWGFFGKGLTGEIARKISDPNEVAKARQFPYQYQTALKHLHPEIPDEIRFALQTAMDCSVGNVPNLPGRTLVFIDMSGSMGSAVTGDRGSGTTVTSCAEVAALFAAILAKRCMGRASLFWFANDAGPIAINPHDSIARISQQVMESPSGGTAISAPLLLVNSSNIRADQIIYLSDNQSWADGQPYRAFTPGTLALQQWQVFKTHNPGAKLVCIDLQANATTQAPDQEDILNIGGWSDRIFPLIAAFLQAKRGEIKEHWVQAIEKVDFTIDASVEEA